MESVPRRQADVLSWYRWWFWCALKGPKTANGKRTITIDDDLIAPLLVEKEKHLRIVAGVPDGVAIDLSLVKLPDGALMFPGMPVPGEGISLTKLRNPDNTTKEFVRRARKLGFVGLRLHDLRGSHETALLDAGMSVHVVAQRCDHDPAVLLRSYAKRTKGADTQAAAIIRAKVEVRRAVGSKLGPNDLPLLSLENGFAPCRPVLSRAT